MCNLRSNQFMHPTGRLLYQKRVGNFTAKPVLSQGWSHY